MIKTLIGDLKQFKKLSHQKQMLIVFLIVLLFGTSIVVGSFLSRGNVQLPSAITDITGQGVVEEVEREPSTTLSITPDSHTMTVGETVDLEVVLSDITVVSADVVLTYDPEVFEITNLTNGTVFPKQIKDSDEEEIDNEEGRVNYHGTVAATKDAADNTSEGTVFTITAKALSETEAATIGFDLDRTKTALGGNNTLGLTVGSIISVQ